MKQLSAYLSFKGNCREAMEFYHSCLGGDLNIMTVGESPVTPQVYGEMKDQVMHSQLKGPAFAIMASDMLMGGPRVKGNTMSLCIVGDSKEELEKYFNKLAQGGKVNQPLKEEFFGTYGSLTDRYGIDWMFQADKPKT